MTTTNGEAPASTVAALEAGTPAPRLRYDPDLLTPRDLIRARTALGGRNPQELMGDPLEQGPLVYWCIRSRTDTGFTYEQALDTPYVEFMAEEDPEGDERPPAASGTATGPGSAGTTTSPAKPRKTTRAPDAAPSSA